MLLHRDGAREAIQLNCLATRTKERKYNFPESPFRTAPDSCIRTVLHIILETRQILDGSMFQKFE